MVDYINRNRSLDELLVTREISQEVYDEVEVNYR